MKSLRVCPGPGLFRFRFVQVQVFFRSRSVLVQVCSGPGLFMSRFVQVQVCPGPGLLRSRSVQTVQTGSVDWMWSLEFSVTASVLAATSPGKESPLNLDAVRTCPAG